MVTPEREKYYRSISQEEQAIRGLLIYKQHELKQRKRFAVTNSHKVKRKNSVRFIRCLHSIRTIKYQINCLKRQLPAPLKHYLDYDICCRCGMHYKHSEIAGTFYCKLCGQAIRPASWYRAERR